MKGPVLITGSPGSGKTYLAARAREQGWDAFDADEIPGLHGWFHRSGRPATFPVDADAGFFEEHRFLWKRPVLERFLNEHPGALLFGTAANVYDMLDLFGRAYFLRVSKQTLRFRLLHPSRGNPMGTIPEQLQLVLNAARHDEERAREAGVPIVDGEAPVSEILNLVTSR